MKLFCRVIAPPGLKEEEEEEEVVAVAADEEEEDGIRFLGAPGC